MIDANDVDKLDEGAALAYGQERSLVEVVIKPELGRTMVRVRSLEGRRRVFEAHLSELSFLNDEEIKRVPT
jgi:hypothetical protein